ncbi:SDR family oxidoreductase [Plantactinospora sp. S1510]|uniref:SDR family oxidoreductase n=1 Tax=Plantactinospora alkalitolerans TaxID=2789879 RepID=A0ABS0GUR8_9ACTN|nr:SDR family oxidoreductase [Plantactinospora alkalitolerans]MBF9129928.1 SDR family oxidoreductase [Plantactinospora alkalitolerans]
MTLTVLVTGASGLVGSEVVARLSGAGHTVFALMHANSEVVRNNGRRLKTLDWREAAPRGSVVRVNGDITKPRLGLSDHQYDALRTVDRVVHVAAVTTFGLPADTYERINIAGTEQVLEFASRTTSSPIPLVHVSTAYVCGERIGVVGEDELDAGQRFGTAYERSKFVAEQSVHRAAGNGLPVVVVRPSIVVGTERNGVIRDFKNIYVVLKAFTEGRVRSVAGNYDATLDLVPVDYVAELISQAVVRFEDAVGRTFHAVGAQEHNLLDFSNVLAEYPSFHVPRFVSPASFSTARMPLGERAYYERVVALYESYFRRSVTFDATAAKVFMPRRPTVRGLPFLRRLLNHGLRTGYLGAPQQSIDSVLGLLDAREAR